MDKIKPMWIIIGVAVIVVLWFISIYNKLVKFKNNRENAFADIDVQLKQRHDLIPQLVATVKGFNMQMEAYPDLKANQNFMQLQEEMSDIENKLASVRRYFNSATREMNNGVQKFPNNILAGMFGFKEQPYFDLGTAQREVLDKAPEVNF